MRAGRRRLRALALVVALPLAGCGEEAPFADVVDDDGGTAVAGRWYTKEAVSRGSAVYARLCAGCHGERAEGSPDWRRRNADGSLPPPPLDGSAHTWHHTSDVLARQIREGTPPQYGTMPGFGDALGDREVVDVIAWIQSLWPDDVYEHWMRRERHHGDGS